VQSAYCRNQPTAAISVERHYLSPSNGENLTPTDKTIKARDMVKNIKVLDKRQAGLARRVRNIRLWLSI
jgi:hypothetical protein